MHFYKALTSQWWCWDFNPSFLDFKAYVLFIIQWGEKFLCSQEFILKSKNLFKDLAYYVSLCLISHRSLEDGNFHNQAELSVTNVFLNSRMLKLSSLRLSHDFLNMPTGAWLRKGRPQHLPRLSRSDHILKNVDRKLPNGFLAFMLGNICSMYNEHSLLLITSCSQTLEFMAFMDWQISKEGWDYKDSNFSAQY